MSLVWIVTQTIWNEAALNPRNPVTLRRVSAELLRDGLDRNTLPEILRLNPSFTVDQVLATGNTSILLWSWILFDIPNPSSSEPEQPHLRMAQRNDGLGLSAHPRLTSRNGPTSTQLRVAPRVGGTKTYF